MRYMIGLIVLILSSLLIGCPSKTVTVEVPVPVYSTPCAHAYPEDVIWPCDLPKGQKWDSPETKKCIGLRMEHLLWLIQQRDATIECDEKAMRKPIDAVNPPLAK